MKIITALLLVHISTCLVAQQNDLVLEKLKGKVKTVANLSNGELTKTITFNEAGFITASRIFCKGGKIACSEYTVEYDANGNKTVNRGDIFTEYFTYDAKGNLAETITLTTMKKDTVKYYRYTWNGQSRTSMEQYNYANGKKLLTGKTTYAYDAAHRLTEEEAYSYYPPNGSDVAYKMPLYSRNTYTYDQSGNLQEKITKDAKGNKLGWYVYKYDDRNRKIESSTVYHDGPERTEAYKYDEKDNVVEIVSAKGDEEIYREEYTFDKQGNCIKKVHSADQLANVTTYTYDASNLQTGEKRTIKGKPSQDIRYTYDKTGNLVLKKVFDGEGKLTHTYQCEIEYYK